MNQSPPTEISRLDVAYQKLTGRRFRASGVVTGREYSWHQFLKAGYTVHDLETVILWIKKGILNGIRFEPSLGFRRLIGDLGIFEDELGAAEAEKRNAKPAVTPKERVVAQARPIAKPELAHVGSDAKPISFYIAELRKAVG